MFRRNPSAQAERAAAAIVGLRMELLDAATAYNVMSVSDGGDLDAAWEPLERLAARARDAEELGADELGDDFLSREGAPCWPPSRTRSCSRSPTTRIAA